LFAAIAVVIVPLNMTQTINITIKNPNVFLILSLFIVSISFLNKTYFMSFATFSYLQKEQQHLQKKIYRICNIFLVYIMRDQGS